MAALTSRPFATCELSASHRRNLVADFSLDLRSADRRRRSARRFERAFFYFPLFFLSFFLRFYIYIFFSFSNEPGVTGDARRSSPGSYARLDVRRQPAFNTVGPTLSVKNDSDRWTDRRAESQSADRYQINETSTAVINLPLTSACAARHPRLPPYSANVSAILDYCSVHGRQ